MIARGARAGVPPDGSESGGAAVITALRWWHIEQLLPIEADLFGAEQWTDGMFWSELASGCHYLAALEPAGDEARDQAHDEVVVGYAGLALVADGEGWINNIAVRRDRQRRGIARRLMAALLEHAERSGAKDVLLEVAADNGAAQRLYDEFGFEVVGVRRGYYQPSNTDALVMRRCA